MLDIKVGDNGEIVLSGRFDASQADKANKAFDPVDDPSALDLAGPEHTPSLGPAVLPTVQTRNGRAPGAPPALGRAPGALGARLLRACPRAARSPARAPPGATRGRRAVRARPRRPVSGRA